MELRSSEAEDMNPKPAQRCKHADNILASSWQLSHVLSSDEKSH